MIMIATTQVDYNRITFSLPQSMNIALDNLKNEIKRSKSEIIKLAIESYLAQQKKIKIQKAVEMMASEYENSDELTEFTVLDSEDFL
jgi:metal-responsive CopG/Arc/MetJ family transcriptional regulator